MKDYIVVSFSGGKDSTAMLLHMMDLGEHIDEVICCDTIKEFPAMYRHIERVRQVVEAAGIKFTALKAEKDFDWWMFEYLPEKSTSHIKLSGNRGFSWAGSRMRWCSDKLKGKVINKYLKSLKQKYNVIQCIGLAADEGYRLKREHNQDPNHRHPLVEWGWTEAFCLQYCYGRGYDWEGLYEIFKRVSCWCSPLQPIGELRKLWKHFPDLWGELKSMDTRTWRNFKEGKSVRYFEIRFQLEEEMAAQGLPTNGRCEVFREALRKRLGVDK